MTLKGCAEISGKDSSAKKNVFLTPTVNILDPVLVLCQIHKTICKNKKCLYSVKPPNRGHSKQRTCHEQRARHLVPTVTIYFKLPPNSGHLSITDKFFKNRWCPLFRGFTVYPSWRKLHNPDIDTIQKQPTRGVFGKANVLQIWVFGMGVLL